MSVLNRAHFHDEKAAFAYVESVIWAKGVVCPHCGVVDSFYDLAKTRIGLKKCKEVGCRKQFTVRVGTIFEDSHLPMFKWLQAIHLVCSSKKGISAHQLHRVLEVQYKTAWYLGHRIREAMRSGDLAPFGGGGGRVEVDETYIGRDKTAGRRNPKGGTEHKMKVLTLVDRTTGAARSMVMDRITTRDVVPILKENIAQEAHVLTDQAGYYRFLGDHFRQHDTVNHQIKEYVRRDDATIHTNTIEGYFSVFKRGMKGVYQHCAKKHLHRYLAEFDFRYNHRIANGFDDTARAVRALNGVVGKRLMYRDSSCPL